MRSTTSVSQTASAISVGSFLVMIFIGCAALNPTREQSFRLAAFYSAGFIVYEFLQPNLPRGVFDWMDVIGTGIGYLISLPILVAVWHVSGPQESPITS